MSSLGKNIFRRRTVTPRKQALNKCSTSGKVDDLVLLSDSEDDNPDVIDLDNLESEKEKIIDIVVVDDDDDDEEEVVGGVCSNDDDSISSSGCPSKPTNSSNFAEANDKNYSFVGKGNSPVNLSKHRQTYPGKVGPGGRYGLGSSGSNESDCSDNELMDGPAEKLREQWEMASKRRKTATHTSGVNPDCHPIHVGEDEVNTSYVSDESSPTHVGKDDKREYEENSFPFADPDRAFENSLNNDNRHYPLDDFATAFPDPGPSSPNIEDASGTGSFSMENSSSKDAEKSHSAEPVMTATKLDDILGSTFIDLETMETTEPCLFNRQPSFDEQFDSGIAEPLKKDPTVSKSQLSGDIDREHDRLASMNANDEQPTSSFRSTRFGKTASSASFWNFKSDHEVDMVEEKDSHCQEPVVSLHDHKKPETGDTFCSSVQMEADGSTCDLFDGLTTHTTDDVLKEVVVEPCQKDVVLDRQSITETEEYKRVMEEEWASRQQQLQIQAEEAQRSRRRKRAESTRIMDVEKRQKQRLEEVRCQKDIVLDRQSIKETDEYKRAMEEEWASRQRQLQIQAEEAQRLRRRKRAESLRIMDVEKRQKQRLEEVRETQRRDEANLNMKEQLRIGIRKQLNLVEGSCNDMASILRRLGLLVGGGLSPSKNEVQAAYKKALLKFHPDRASRTDIRLQVEAEEKFKLISRMKEKFPLT